MCPQRLREATLIPLNTLCKKDFPKPFQDKAVLQFVKTLAPLTANIQVQGVSHDRTSDYPCYQHRGSDSFKRAGCGVVMLHDLKQEFRELDDCLIEAVDGKRFGVHGSIRVKTTTTLVFDNWEAQRSKITLCFDSDQGSSKHVSLTPISVCNRSLEHDTIEIECATSDSTLAERLEKVSRKRNELWKGKMGRNANNADTITVCVSQSDGGERSASIGKCIHMSEVGGPCTPCGANACSLRFEVPLVKGTIGAPVWIWSRNRNVFGMVNHIKLAMDESSPSSPTKELSYYGLGTGPLHQYTNVICPKCY